MTNKASLNFTWTELECKCGCGTRNITDDSIRKLQKLRSLVGYPLTINSAARCEKHNRAVGGVSGSKHLSKDDYPSYAFDISTNGHSQIAILKAAEQVGFGGIGRYNTFIHVDDRSSIARWDYRKNT
jgi:uncharacterized protein YcbK (DUF882 family)